MNAWLFSFVDLAFMLLIAFSQIQDHTLDNVIQYQNIQLADIGSEGKGDPMNYDQKGRNYYVEINNNHSDKVIKGEGKETKQAPKNIFKLGYKVWNKKGKYLESMIYETETHDINVLKEKLLELYSKQQKNEEQRLITVAADKKAYFQNVLLVSQIVEKIWKQAPDHTVKKSNVVN